MNLRKIGFSLLVFLSLYFAFKAVVYHQAIAVHGGTEDTILNRATYSLAAAYVILAAATVTYFYNRKVGLMISANAFLVAFTSNWVAMFSPTAVLGWFTYVPVLGLLWFLTELYLLPPNKRL